VTENAQNSREQYAPWDLLCAHIRSSLGKQATQLTASTHMNTPKVPSLFQDGALSTCHWLLWTYWKVDVGLTFLWEES
jgi:hypothetical protein